MADKPADNSTSFICPICKKKFMTKKRVCDDDGWGEDRMWILQCTCKGFKKFEELQSIPMR